MVHEAEDPLKKIQILIKRFNDTFEIEPNIVNDNGDDITNSLRIKKLNNDGVEFMNDIFSTFAQIVKSISPEHELVYDKMKGLALARRKVIYEIED